VREVAFGVKDTQTLTLCALGFDGQLRAWTVGGHHSITRLTLDREGPKATTMTFLPTADAHAYLVIGDESGTVEIWDPLVGNKIREFRAPEANVKVTAVAVGESSAGRRLLASADSDGLVVVRDLDLDTVVVEMRHHFFKALALAFGGVPDGRPLLVCAGHTGRLDIWDVEGRAHALTLRRRTNINRVHAQGLRFGIGDAESVSVIDLINPLE